ncbi:general transcription factor IIF subunit 2 [Neocloeon triangulifer]|uniref:general transcription factor IIF subunit 2 n=1 Tax=Neocloeon triangulifer TaxID=2078957 RepID=UPI00286F6A96|nr:general transcription factor IIF subunit 2 [Neocloeon triangulifer]
MSTHQGHHPDRELDLSNAGRGVWLVKVPKYIAARWDRAPGNVDVGKLRISKVPGQKTHVSLSLSQAVLAMKDDEKKKSKGDPEDLEIPQNHMLDVSAVTRQALGVFSHHLPTNCNDVVPESEKLVFEGQIVQKLECRPQANEKYMSLKLDAIRKAAIPHRTVKQLDKIVQNYKPVSDHKHNIEYEEKKKAEGKKARDDRDAVQEMLFSAFEKHQYYNIKDLVKITRQPIVYLKEILKDVCVYNLKNPHKNMWELKPEYRHYKDTDAPSTSTD